jgi:hypothetical protein
MPDKIPFTIHSSDLNNASTLIEIELSVDREKVVVLNRKVKYSIDIIIKDSPIPTK